MNESIELEIRVQKWLSNRHRVRQALLELLETQEFQAIQTEMIIEKSQIPHRTFYECCNGKYDLVKSWIRTERQDYENLVKEIFEQENISDIISGFVLKIEIFDSKGLDMFLEKLSPTRDDLPKYILTLWKICTPRINLYRDMNNILKQAFINAACKHIDATKDWEYQATIFAYLSLILQRDYLMMRPSQLQLSNQSQLLEQAQNEWEKVFEQENVSLV